MTFEHVYLCDKKALAQVLDQQAKHLFEDKRAHFLDFAYFGLFVLLFVVAAAAA